MKIGFARYSQACDIDFYNASAKLLGTELRVGLLEALVQLGHEVTILSIVPASQAWLFKNQNHPIYDYSWLAKVKYQPKEIPTDLDLLIIENSTTNAFYGGENLFRTAELLKEIHDTKLVVYQHADITDAVAVPLSRIYNAIPDPKLAKVNLKNIFGGTELNGNQWTIWSHANNEKAVMGAKGNNVSYHLWANNHIGFPLGYSKNFDRPLAKFEKEDMVDIVYIGGEKSQFRNERLFKLAGTNDCCRRILFGNWKNPPNGWYYGGTVEGHGRAYAFMPMGKAAICVSDKWPYLSGQLTSRLTMAMRAGQISFGDHLWSGLDRILGPGAIIENHEQIHEFLPHWKDISNEQNNRIKTWEEIYSDILEKT
jgi:hypothetical protein